MNWLRKIWNWIQSSFHKDLPDPVNEVYAMRMDDVINERPRASGGEIRRTELTYHFDTGPSFNEISIVPGTDMLGDYFTADTIFTPQVNLQIGEFTLFESHSDWMKRQIKALEDKGLA